MVDTVDIRAYVYDKFIASPYYTPEATVVYALLLVALVSVIYDRVIKRMGIKVDKRFVLTIVPFVVFGALTRSVGDTVLSTSGKTGVAYLLITPGVYFLTFVIASAVLLVALALQRKAGVRYEKTMIIVGSTLVAAELAYLVNFGIPNVRGMALALGIASVWFVALLAASQKFPKYLTRENAYVLAAHMLDASATFVALAFTSGLFEEHVLPRFLIGTLGLSPAVMFVLKLAVVWPVLYYIDRDVRDAEYRMWLKIIVLILGLPLGIRDVFAIGMLGTPTF
ncbi:MAG: DUF63 family protein [Candidatus Aenigmarchaeota archaeon]|nr:DUF63 family protein [Candidatus Aenigmarchaeota archaeon]